MDPIENGDIPASHVSLPEGMFSLGAVGCGFSYLESTRRGQKLDQETTFGSSFSSPSSKASLILFFQKQRNKNNILA